MPSERGPNNGFSPVGVRGVGKYSTPFSGTKGGGRACRLVRPLLQEADTVGTIRALA